MYLFRDFPLSQRKEVRSALLGIYGVSWRKSINIVCKTGIGFPYFMPNLNSYQFSLLFLLLKGYVISDVRIKRRINTNINLMINNGSYTGIRHKLSLPVRGQRTRTNANTQRSKRVRNQRIR